jgi:hypothetical protein
LGDALEDVRRHRIELEALKLTDPAFYKFLQEDDEGKVRKLVFFNSLFLLA